MTVSDDPSTQVTIEIATASKWIATISKLAPKLPQPQRQQLEDAARKAQGLLYPATFHYLLAQRQSQTVGVAWGQHLPGSMSQIRNVIMTHTEAEQTALALVNGMDQEFEKQGVSFSMIILEESSSTLRSTLEYSGYDSLCQVETMYQPLISARAQPLTSTLEFVSGAESKRTELISIIEATYQQSLDCPKLQDMRSTNDILDGYQQQGSIPVDGWSFVHHGNTVIGCLLMTAFEGEKYWELTYFGLTPEARGQGWGSQVVQQACSHAATAGAELLITTVDQANQPALAIYRQLGFIPMENNEIFAKQLKTYH